MLEELIKRRRKVKMVLHDGGSLLMLKWKVEGGGKPDGRTIKCIDLFRFMTRGSLAENCASFELETQKGRVECWRI